MNVLTPEAPIVYLVFNRPEHTRKSFAAIRAVRPKRLFVVADGPRNSTEKGLCEEVRQITEHVDWPCEVERKYSDVNLGCDPCSTAGISWAFTKTDRIVFIEDDGVIHPDFFPYCNELLERYKDDRRILLIGDNGYQHANPKFSNPDSYFFATIPVIHAIGIWKHSWNLYDTHMTAWPEVKQRQLLRSVFPDEAVRAHFEFKFDQYYSGKLTNWDGKLLFASVLNRCVSIFPRVNLVSNIGYGPGATNSANPNDEKANLPTLPLPLPLAHPPGIVVDAEAERYLYTFVFGINRSLRQKSISFVRYFLPRFYRLIKRLKGEKNSV